METKILKDVEFGADRGSCTIFNKIFIYEFCHKYYVVANRILVKNNEDAFYDSIKACDTLAEANKRFEELLKNFS